MFACARARDAARLRGRDVRLPDAWPRSGRTPERDAPKPVCRRRSACTLRNLDATRSRCQPLESAGSRRLWRRFGEGLAKDPWRWTRVRFFGRAISTVPRPGRCLSPWRVPLALATAAPPGRCRSAWPVPLALGGAARLGRCLSRRSAAASRPVGRCLSPRPAVASRPVRPAASRPVRPAGASRPGRCLSPWFRPGVSATTVCRSKLRASGQRISRIFLCLNKGWLTRRMPTSRLLGEHRSDVAYTQAAPGRLICRRRNN